jgi:hypothetical protein
VTTRGGGSEMRATSGTRTRWAGILALAVLAACLLAAAPARAAVTYDAAVGTMVTGVTQAQLLPGVMELTGETPAVVAGVSCTIPSRASSSGATGIDKAEQYVYERLLSYGLTNVSYQSFPGQGGSVPGGRNVIAQITGTTNPGKIVVVSAHLDDRPWFSVSPVAYGADDDASGCAALLYIARNFAGHTFANTVRFVFFDCEENAPWGKTTYGSGYYAYRAKAAGENIVAEIDGDALAWNGSNNRVAYMVTRAGKKDTGNGDHAIATLWQQAVATYGITGMTPTVQASGDNLSDHGSFWANGYNAVMLIEDDTSQVNPNWHTLGDRVSTFNWPFYIAVVKSEVAVAAHEAGILQ